MTSRLAFLSIAAAVFVAGCGLVGGESDSDPAALAPEDLAFEVTLEPDEPVDTSPSAALCADIVDLFSGRVAVVGSGSEQTTALMEQTKKFVEIPTAVVLDGLIALINGEPGSSEYLLGIEHSPAFWEIDAVTFDLCGTPLVNGMRDMGACTVAAIPGDSTAETGDQESTPSCHEVRFEQMGGLCFEETGATQFRDPNGQSFDARTFVRVECESDADSDAQVEPAADSLSD